jgi:hypothetical protein
VTGTTVAADTHKPRRLCRHSRFARWLLHKAAAVAEARYLWGWSGLDCCRLGCGGSVPINLG